MLKNYFFTAYHNLLRNKSHTAAYMASLTTSIATCLLLFVVIRFETSFETFYRNTERIYRVAAEYETLDGTHQGYGLPLPVSDRLRAE